MFCLQLRPPNLAIFPPNSLVSTEPTPSEPAPFCLRSTHPPRHPWRLKHTRNLSPVVSKVGYGNFKVTPLPALSAHQVSQYKPMLTNVATKTWPKRMCQALPNYHQLIPKPMCAMRVTWHEAMGLLWPQNLLTPCLAMSPAEGPGMARHHR